MIEWLGCSKHLLTLVGACHAIQVQLDQEAVPFGSVTHKSTSEKRVILSNSGDIGVKFNWDAEALMPDFTIEPTQGYITPGQSCPLRYDKQCLKIT